MKARGLPSLTKDVVDDTVYPEDKAFFTTEPLKNKKIHSQRKRVWLW